MPEITIYDSIITKVKYIPFNDTIAVFVYVRGRKKRFKLGTFLSVHISLQPTKLIGLSLGKAQKLLRDQISSHIKVIKLLKRS